VYRLQRKGISLDPRRDLLQPHMPLWEAWVAFFTQQAMGHPTYVLYDPHDGEAFVQVHYRPHQAAADVIFIAPALIQNRRSSNAWSRLLDGACVEAARRGIQRVFANLPSSGAEVDAFQQSGFSLYTGEDLYCLPELPTSRTQDMPSGLRLQHPEDWPAIQKLCVTITPQRIRQAEGGISIAMGRTKDCSRYVLPMAESEELAAVLEIYAGKRAHWLRLLIHPDARSAAEGLVRWALVALSDHPGRPVHCNVRQYESGVRAVLEDAGFQPHAARALMVRDTMAWVRVSTQELAPALKSSAEAVPPAYNINGDPEFRASNGPLAADRKA
jgi:hypothetical protein